MTSQCDHTIDRRDDRPSEVGYSVDHIVTPLLVCLGVALWFSPHLPLDDAGTTLWQLAWSQPLPDPDVVTVTLREGLAQLAVFAIMAMTVVVIAGARRLQTISWLHLPLVVVALVVRMMTHGLGMEGMLVEAVWRWTFWVPVLVVAFLWGKRILLAPWTTDIR